jgi:hypothetical protein
MPADLAERPAGLVDLQGVLGGVPGPLEVPAAEAAALLLLVDPAELGDVDAVSAVQDGQQVALLLVELDDGGH